MTPYDTPLRIQRREVDNMRVSISVEVERMGKIEAAQSEHERRMHEERKIAASAEIRLPSDAWTMRAKAQRAQLAEQQRAADARLNDLRAKAVEVYGTMRAIESAADRHREESARAIATAEQARIDDLGAARFVRALRDAKKRPS